MNAYYILYELSLQGIFGSITYGKRDVVHNGESVAKLKLII